MVRGPSQVGISSAARGLASMGRVLVSILPVRELDLGLSCKHHITSLCTGEVARTRGIGFLGS